MFNVGYQVKTPFVSPSAMACYTDCYSYIDCYNYAYLVSNSTCYELNNTSVLVPNANAISAHWNCTPSFSSNDTTTNPNGPYSSTITSNTSIYNFFTFSKHAIQVTILDALMLFYAYTNLLNDY